MDDDRTDAKNGKKPMQNQHIENDKIAATSSTIINGNKENIRDKNLKNSSSSFIDMEKQNGNKVTSENETIDTNSNRSYTVT